MVIYLYLFMYESTFEYFMSFGRGIGAERVGSFFLWDENWVIYLRIKYRQCRDKNHNLIILSHNEYAL